MGNVNAVRTGRYCWRSGHLDELTLEERRAFIREVLRVLENRMTPEQIYQARRRWQKYRRARIR